MDYWYQFWKNKNKPEHVFDSDYWYENYAKEILFFLPDKCKSAVDLGCGSGEVLSFVAKKVEQIIGIDFSEKMIQSASDVVKQKNLTNVKLYCDNILNIDNILKNQKVDCFYNLGVMQYLSIEQIDELIQKCLSLLREKGRIVVIGIPDKKHYALYSVDFYRDEKYLSFLHLFLKYIRFTFWWKRKTLFRPELKQKYSIGNWFLKEDFRQIAKKYSLNVLFTYSFFPPYGYRFNAVFFR